MQRPPQALAMSAPAGVSTGHVPALAQPLVEHASAANIPSRFVVRNYTKLQRNESTPMEPATLVARSSCSRTIARASAPEASPTRRSTTNMMRAHLLTALAGAVALAPALGYANRPAAPETALVEYRDLDQVMAAEGVVEAARESTLAAQIPGRIVALNVRAGDRVRAGQVLAQIDARSAAQAEGASQSQVREAEANLANVKARYQRSRQLATQKFISQAALDQAEAEYVAAQEQTAVAIAHAGQAATSRSFATISAPYAGVIASTEVEVGDLATPGRPLLTVFDPHELRVTATLPQAVLGAAKLDAPVNVELPTLGRTLTATGITVLPVADTRTHTTRVRLTLPEAAALLPGQYARALFVTGHARVLAIPESAVLRRSEVTAVYVLDRSGTARLRQVRLGEPAGRGLVEVTAGVAPGERVSLEPVRSGIEASRGGDRSS